MHRPVKLRLYEVMIELGVPLATSWRSHWPMHGPQALARTVPPAFSKMPSWPSRAMVARTCSEPGVTVNLALKSRPWSSASWVIEADRLMSSYDELVQEPMRPTLSSSGQPSDLTFAANLLMGVAKSGV